MRTQEAQEASGQVPCFLADPHLWAVHDIFTATAGQPVFLSAHPVANTYLASEDCSEHQHKVERTSLWSTRCLMVP